MTTLDDANDDLAEEQRALRQLLEDALVALNHELRTPLAAMKGYTTTLLKHERRLRRDERLAMLREIDGACDRMTNVIEQAMQAVRLAGETVQMDLRPLDISIVARETIAESSEHLLADRSVQMTVTASIAPIVLGDAHRLQQVLLRLLDNAIRFSPPDAPVEVAITSEPAQSRGTQPTVVVHVRDHGIGIPPAMAAHVFDPFFRVESGLIQLSGGLGLGLTYCLRTIERHGGTIWCEPAPGDGTIFAFRLAAAPAASA